MSHEAGHYHVEMQAPEHEGTDNSACVNDTFEVVKSRIHSCDFKILNVGFICTYGCGVIHEMTEEGLKDLGLRMLPGYSSGMALKAMGRVPDYERIPDAVRPHSN